jgi:hypothetical protein
MNVDLNFKKINHWSEKNTKVFNLISNFYQNKIRIILVANYFYFITYPNMKNKCIRKFFKMCKIFNSLHLKT